LRDVEPDDLAALYQLASLVAHGVQLAAGSDAPFGALDPGSTLSRLGGRSSIRRLGAQPACLTVVSPRSSRPAA
jgi:predicted amidohydrolase YtcJ